MAMATATIDALAVGSVTTWAGPVRVTASAAGVRQVWLPDWREPRVPIPPRQPQTAEPDVSLASSGSGAAEGQLRAACAALAAYFAGGQRTFGVPLDLRGTDFQRTVWAEVARVPYGETRTYAEIAQAIRAPRAVRAVGAANGANPVAPLIPCHRIVGSDGHLTGYGPGLPLKQRLLLMEDALPAGPDDYVAWTARTAARLGGQALYLGLRGVGIYCRPDCPRALPQRLLPARLLRSAADASLASFSPCPVCRPAVQSAAFPPARAVGAL